MEWLDALLDLIDATFTAIGWVAFWYAWVAPGRRHALPPPEPPSSADELERFLGQAAVRGSAEAA